MFYEKHQNAAASRITVTATATNIFDLINTAAGGSSPVNAGFSSNVNGIDISVEDGNVRLLIDDNVPTSANGFLLQGGNTYFLRNIPVNKMQLIRETANVTCSVMIGRCLPGESSGLGGAGGGTGSAAQQIQGNIANAATDSGNPVKVGGVYLTSKPTYTNGQRTNLQTNVNGAVDMNEVNVAQAEDNSNGVFAVSDKPLATNTYSPSRAVDFGSNVTLNVKSTAGNVIAVMVRNLNAAERFFQLHNTATTPGGGAVPLVSIPVPGNGLIILGSDFFAKGGVFFSTGIAYGFSTTQGTYTAGTAADQFNHVIYK